jgi:membrane protease YdiL (CAAX protease family)
VHLSFLGSEKGIVTLSINKRPYPWYSLGGSGLKNSLLYGIGTIFVVTISTTVSFIISIPIYIANDLALSGDKVDFIAEALAGKCANFIIQNIGIISGLLGLLVAVWVIHNRSFITLFNAEGKILWRRIFMSFALWIFVSTIFLFVILIISPKSGYLQADFGATVCILPLALVLTPLQAGAEELFFRAYLAQGIWSAVHSRTVVILLTSIVFWAVHIPGSVEIWTTVRIALLGLLLGIVSAREQRIETAIGIHAANNLWFEVVQQQGITVSSALNLRSSAEQYAGIAQLIFVSAIFAVLHYRVKWKLRGKDV